MDDTAQEQSTVGASQLPHYIAPDQSNQLMGTSAQVSAGQPTSAGQVVPSSLPTSYPVAPIQLTQEQLSYQHIYQQHLKQLQQQLQTFWEKQRQEIEETTDFKNHSLPLARIKKIMKADEDVRMIAAEAPVLFARACETFILELTLRAWAHTEENKRRTLQKNDIAAAITRTDAFDFLVDIVPRDEVKEDVLLSVPGVGGSNETVPYYYMPAPVAPPGMIVGRSAIDPAMLYAQQPHAYMTHQVWPLQQEHQQQPTSDS